MSVALFTNKPVAVQLRPNKARSEIEPSVFYLESGWRFDSSGVIGVYERDDYASSRMKKRVRVLIPYDNIELMEQDVDS